MVFPTLLVSSGWNTAGVYPSIVKIKLKMVLKRIN